MRNDHIVAVVVLLVLSLSAGSVLAQEEIAATRGEAGVAENPLEFDEGPAGFLFTKKDRKEWKKIKTQAEAEEFIELFWARRNPDPTVSFNPFKAQFDTKVAYADENFESRGDRGALSDRGKVLILLGPPHGTDIRNAQDVVQEMDTGNFGGDEARGNMEVWLYESAGLPEQLEIRASRLFFVFYEDLVGTNRYRLDSSNPEATMASRALAKAPDVYLLHADLQEVPKPVSFPGAAAASATHLAWLKGPEAPLSDSAIVTVETGVSDAAGRPLWFQLELPDGAPPLDLLTGTVSAPDGEVLSTFEVAVEPVSIGDEVAYHLAFPLAEGSYTLSVIGAAAGEPQAGYIADVTVPGAPEEGTWMSSIWLAVDKEMKDDAVLGAPYSFGRMHIAPLISGAEIKRQSELTIVGFVVRPGEEEGGTPRAKARIVLNKDGDRLGRPLEMPMEVLQLSGELYVFINAINLAALPEAGEYRLEVTVRDPISDVKVEREIDLAIVN